MLERLAPGTRFGDLEIERELGVGAFGRVYVARDTLIGRRVALKVVQATRETAGPEGRAFILREARAIGKLNSEHIVTLYRVHPPQAEGGAWMFQMEFVEGGSLDDLLHRDETLPPARAREVGAGIAVALKCAHDANVVHGDVKPGNVLLARDGTPKLADFGLARVLGDPSVSLSDTGELVGTPVYMAPEVVMGERATAASDIWSFGVVLHRMLAGRPPFRGRQLPTLFYAIQQADPLPLPSHVPADLAALVFHCLVKQPAERPRAGAELLAYLSEQGEHAAPVPPRPLPRRIELVGREREMTRISKLLTGALEGKGASVLVTGETGIGKSTLARETHEEARQGGFRCVEARISSLRGLLRPLLEAMRGLVEEEGLRPTDSQLFGSAAALVGRLLTQESSLKLESRSQALWALENLLTGLAHQPPLAVILEDAHNADESELEVLRHLARTLPRSGVFLLLTARTAGPAGTDAGVVAMLSPLDEVVHLPLEPLSQEDAYRLIQQWAGGGHIAAEVSRRVLEVSQGNPLFVVELLKHLEQTRSIASVRGMLRPGPRWGETTLPHRFHELAATRLGDLAEEDRALIDAAAVDGVSFDGEAVAAAVGEPLLAVLRRLQRLYRTTGIIVPGAEGYRFSSAVFQEVIYRDLAPELRRRIHLDLARHLQSRGSEVRVEPERIGLHWEKAGRPGDAAPYLLKAAHAAAERQEAGRAIELATRGGVTPDSLEPRDALRHRELVLALSDAYYGSGQPDRAASLLGGLVEAATEARDETLRLRATVARDFLRFFQQGAEAVEEQEILDAAARLPLCKERGRARYLLGVIEKYRGDLAAAERWLREADEVFSALALDAMHSSTLDQLASVASRSGRVSEAEDLYGDAARISDQAGRKPNAAASRVNAAFAAFRRGNLDGIAARLERPITELALHGARNLSAHGLVILARARYALGDLAGAETAIDESLAILGELNYLPGLLAAHYTKALLCGVAGALVEAEAHLGRARGIAEKEEAGADLVRIAFLGALGALWRGDRRLAASLVETGLRRVRARAAVHGDALLLLTECVFFGSDPAPLVEALALPAGPGMRDEPETALARAVAPAMVALADPKGTPDTLEGGARDVASAPAGDHRAAWRLVATYLEAESHVRRNDELTATRLLDNALQDARALGHVWLQAGVLRSLARLAPDSIYPRRLRDHLDAIAPGLGITDDFGGFFSAWS